jgi:adenylylsulfate kinase
MTANPTANPSGSATNIVWHQASVTRADRAKQRGHRSAILWLTGLSGSGKSTLANAINAELFGRGLATHVLDGDNVRHGLCQDLGFSDSDREENIRRIGEVAKLFLDAGVIVITAFVSPFRADRRRARALVETDDFIEIHCAADLDVCERRDPKGLYAKARAGQIKDFTGISSPYEAPEAAEIEVPTGRQSLEESVFQVITYLEEHAVVTAGSIRSAGG